MDESGRADLSDHGRLGLLVLLWLLSDADDDKDEDDDNDDTTPSDDVYQHVVQLTRPTLTVLLV